MKLYESTAKKFFKQYGILTPLGFIANTPEEVVNQFVSGGKNEYILKAQILEGGRGKRGLIQKVSSLQEARDQAYTIMDYPLNNERVHHLLLEEMVDISQELYLSFSIDNVAGCVVLVFSEKGGVEVENINTTGNSYLKKLWIDPLEGLKKYQIITLLKETNINKSTYSKLANVVMSAYRLFTDIDAILLEINPLVITSDNEVIAVDAKVELDENSVSRNLLVKHELTKSSSPLKHNEDNLTSKYGITYVEFDGDIAILSGGAGMTMAIVDAIKHEGGNPANFIDVSSGSGIDSLKKMTEIIVMKANNDETIKCILLNIITSATSIDVVTNSMTSVINKLKPKVPIVGRVVAAGIATSKMSLEESLKHFSNAGVILFDEITDAISEAVSISQKEDSLR